MLSWLSGEQVGGKSALTVASPDENIRQLEDVLRAADFIFTDDFGEAEASLAEGISPYHMLGKGMMVILKSSLGFEEDLMQDAGEYLDEAEGSSRTALQRVQVDAGDTYSLYPPGTDLKLCYAEAKLANAIRAAVSESMTEYIKGLYKIRQSYVALKSIVNEEAQFMERHRGRKIDVGTTEEELDKWKHDQEGPVSTSPKSKTAETAELPKGNASSRTNNSLQTTDFPCLDLHSNSPLVQDISASYTYSGAHVCFGAMLVILSLIPTSFQQVLRVIGFRGNKERGYDMLWQATRFQNIHGACAGLLLLSLYNVIRATCDISDGEVYPRQRCAELLKEMRKRYPKSAFWMLEEARALEVNSKLEEAIEVLSRPLTNPVKQLGALVLLEKSMCQMFIHDYEACSEAFIKIISMNKYSQALYYYNAASCQIALYRRTLPHLPATALQHKAKAAQYLHTALHGIDRKTLYATELPFDSFVVRKITKWTELAKRRGIDLVDAVGVSPLEEIVYIYGGHKWMREGQLRESMAAIAWSEGRDQGEEVDEKGIGIVLKAVVQRGLGDTVGARETLAGVVGLERKLFRGKGKDDWVLPAAHYEMAVLCWMEKEVEGVAEGQKVRECEGWLDKVVRWGSYELDSRILLKAKSAQDVVANYKARRRLAKSSR